MVPPGTTAHVTLPFGPDRGAVTVGPGAHAWRCEAPPIHRYTLDTPLHALRGDAVLWRDVRRALEAVRPGASGRVEHLFATSPTLQHVLASLPRVPQGLEAGLRRAVDREPRW